MKEVRTKSHTITWILTDKKGATLKQYSLKVLSGLHTPSHVIPAIRDLCAVTTDTGDQLIGYVTQVAHSYKAHTHPYKSSPSTYYSHLDYSILIYMEQEV